MATKLSKPIKNYLTDFGLNDKEIELYMTLLKTGPSTIMDLSRESGIKRSTTHNNVEELIKKGLVSQTNYGERRMVVAEDPGKLQFLMDQKKWDLKKLEENMPDIVSLIKENVPSAPESFDVKVKYYDGKEGTSLIYKEAFNAKELRSYVNLEAVSKVFPENGQVFLEQQKNRRSDIVKEILDKTDESLARANSFSKSTNFSYKISPVPMNLSTIDVLIYDGKVATINFKDSITGTVIANKDYYENSKAVFEFIWKMLPE